MTESPVTDSERCPHCKVSLRGAPIPTEDLAAGHYGKWDGITPRFYSHKIGHEFRGQYDGVLFWSCPTCGGTWHRWPADTRQHKIASDIGVTMEVPDDYV